MPTKKQVISQTRNKRSVDEGRKDLNKKQKKERGVPASYLIFENVHVLKHPNELLALIDKQINKNRNVGEEESRLVDQKEDTITYEFMEKNICLSIARHVESAFKNHHPVVKMLNPDDNEFYRIKVIFK
ncbi:MAG: hypothetical protein Q8P20_02935 [bacterium]|nr:hypothetical protein [bacterium]